ncbi:AB hydrolase superfamily protein [Abortiporus biennis]
MPKSRRTTAKITIQSPNSQDVSLTGILEQLQPTENTTHRKLALLLHGSMGHKDNLFIKPLALSLPLDSFRFDFRGNHESTGTWRVSGFADDAEDIETVINYLKHQYGYNTVLIIAHSRAVVGALRWLCTSEYSRDISGFVNIGGSYRPVAEPSYEKSTANREAAMVHGWYEVTHPVAGKPTTFKIKKEDLLEIKAFDRGIIWDHFPAHIHVLTIHGLADCLVPPYDAVIHARALSSRTPGTHNLALVEYADHLFSSLYDILITIVLQWWDMTGRGVLKNGFWNTLPTSYKGKL